MPGSDPHLLYDSEQVFFPWLSRSLPKATVTGLAGQIRVSEPWLPGEPPGELYKNHSASRPLRTLRVRSLGAGPGPSGL